MTDPERLVAEARRRRADTFAGALAWAFFSIWAAGAAGELVNLAVALVRQAAGRG